jgi:hypothetical protein
MVSVCVCTLPFSHAHTHTHPFASLITPTGGCETFSQRVLVCDEHYKPERGSAEQTPPMLFYTGNEGDIWMFYNNTGFIFEAAKELNALVVFCEHR